MRKKTTRQVFATKRTPLDELTGVGQVLIFVLVVSGVVNVLALTGSFYMLQIYDRALTSQSIPTLLALSALAIGLYLIQGLLDVSRSQILVRLGARFDQKLAPLAHQVVIDMPRFGFSTAEANERGRDVDTLRSFLGGQGPMALFDLPWMPLYVAFVYMLHPTLGLVTIGGAIFLTLLTVLAEVLTKKHSTAAQKAAVARASIADSHARNADVIRAMGFSSRAIARFAKINSEHLELQTKTNDVAGTLGGISKVLRMILQSAVLGLGAYLTIAGELTAGAIIAASIAASRALAPVDLAISQWKGVVNARRSYARLTETLTSLVMEKPAVTLPAPKSSLKVERITVAAPSTGAVVLSDVSFELKAGQAAGIIGPSGGGKSTMVRALSGVWPLLRGHLRLDEADYNQWVPDDLGRHIGYLPQEVSLLDGTISENISRFEPDADGRKVLEAAQAAGVHEMIVRLPDGYETELGPNGTALSAGQRQRLALARALYANPFLVILDEPNSNLDAEGEAALTAAVQSVRDRKGIVIVVAHRPSALAACDMIGVVQNGKLAAFGPKEEILGSNAIVKVGTKKSKNVA
ncbi:MAG: type I secretion system permease/ATPase [Hyphomicrobium sp.]|nr:type I secretion system permease/ATPase [Hyphomicrobium sp.]